ncbi:hypothetical protein DFR29_101442 [Tahibacter aquaticus]|uniref:Dolichyl-phosphate-mannose-protein mannosyltransferase n=1 Tax=Tahibacter aquaticus TaxID=520092 RepID=A0A4R6ZA59_9GAMM|nr:hypothetical protein DFR29_101442 [Tahibacter aquaticus]
MTAPVSTAPAVERPAATAAAADARHASARRAVVVAVVCALMVLAARAWLVLTFGSSLPFWDQWAAEGMGTFKPLLEGRYDWHQLFSAHNEHRIGLTRLWAIALFLLNDAQWDARVQCLANALIVCTSVGLFAAYLVRRLPAGRAAMLCGLLVLTAVLPFSWENTIAGFQNGFYFLILLTFALLWIAAHRPPSPGTLLLLVVLSLASVFTIATGIFAPLSCCAVLVSRAFAGRVSWRATALLVVPLLVIALAAATQIPHPAYHESLRTQDLFELVRAVAVTTSWPFVAPATLALSLPFALFFWRFCSKREADSVDLFFSGLYVWWALTAFATAYSRGHDMLGVPSRYTDLLAFGCMALGYFALRLLDAPNEGAAQRRRQRALAASVALLLCGGFVAQSVVHVPLLLDRHFLTRIEAVNVRAFIDGDATALSAKPAFYIPYPDAAALGAALSDTTLRRFLPVSVAPRDGTNAATHCAPPGPVAAQHPAPEVCPPTAGRLSALSVALWQRFAPGVLPRLEPQARPDLQTGLRCTLHTLNATGPQGDKMFVVTYAATLRVAGIVVHTGTPAERRPLQIGLLSESGQFYAATTWRPRARDPVVHLPGQAVSRGASFDLGVDASAVPHGRYRIMLGDADPAESCDSGYRLDILRDSDAMLMY